jgi:NAD(P)H-hydrate repair Nnr-like enzyme with NAD(P)H-hydrate dehydratase domain
MGDHLSGVAGALLAAGAAPRDAAGVALHYSGRAAELARRGRSLSPRDVTESLARAFARPGPLEPPRGMPFVTFDQPARW